MNNTIITIIITIIINIYIAQIPCEYAQMRVTNKYKLNITKTLLKRL